MRTRTAGLAGDPSGPAPRPGAGGAAPTRGTAGSRLPPKDVNLKSGSERLWTNTAALRGGVLGQDLVIQPRARAAQTREGRGSKNLRVPAESPARGVLAVSDRDPRPRPGHPFTGPRGAALKSGLGSAPARARGPASPPSPALSLSAHCAAQRTAAGGGRPLICEPRRAQRLRTTRLPRPPRGAREWGARACTSEEKPAPRESAP